MRLDVRLDRAQLVPVGAQDGSPHLGDAGGIRQRGRVELAAAEGAGERRRPRQHELGAGSLRWRLASSSLMTVASRTSSPNEDPPGQPLGARH